MSDRRDDPTNGELLVHLQHITARVDETHGDVKLLIEKAGNHEARLVTLEKMPAQAAAGKTATSVLGMLGGFIGGIVSGFIGGKSSGH